MGQPATNPPRDTYADLVQFDNPAAYWEMKDDAASLAERATIGPTLNVDTTVTNGMTALSDGAIVGGNPDPFSALQLAAGQYLLSDVVSQGDSIDLGNLTEMSAEAWANPAAASGSTTVIANGTNVQWTLKLLSTGVANFQVFNTVPTGFSVSSAVGIPIGVWTHIMGTLSGGTLTIYVNGVASGTASFTGKILPASGTGQIRVGSTTNAITLGVDELAFYRSALAADRVAAHYVAGANRGFARSQLAGERIGRILDAIQHQAPRALGAGTRELAGQYTGGGPNTLDLLTEVKHAEAVDAVLFIARDGTVTFLDAAHRSVPPHDTVQATFGDGGGTELDFMDIQLDYSDAFLANEWNVTREGGTTQSTSDSTSISSYFKRPQSLTGLKLRDDADAATVATSMLAKYKDPLTRVVSIAPKTMDTAVIDAVFRLDIGDRVRVLLTPPGGGARFDQTLFVESIAIDATPQDVYPHVTLGVSPV